jgi:hypothetical protein
VGPSILNPRPTRSRFLGSGACVTILNPYSHFHLVSGKSRDGGTNHAGDRWGIKSNHASLLMRTRVIVIKGSRTAWAGSVSQNIIRGGTECLVKTPSAQIGPSPSTQYKGCPPWDERKGVVDEMRMRRDGSMFS